MKVFFSHSSGDKPLLREIESFAPRHVSCWIDDDKLSLGQEIERTLSSAINDVDFVVIFISSKSLESEWVIKELDWALTVEKERGSVFALPVLLEDVWQKVVPKEFQKRKFLKCLSRNRHDVEAFSTKLFLELSALREDEIGSLKTVKDENTIGKDTFGIVSGFRETAYDLIAPWYDEWYKNHWENDGIQNSIMTILEDGFPALELTELKSWKILDTAVGTGNTYVSFVNNGFHDTYGTDGSREMLLRAYENCKKSAIGTRNLLWKQPINWTDTRSYTRRFGESSFDLVVNTANSFCHIPPTPEYTLQALTSFYNLLRPGGALIIDTKRYCGESTEEYLGSTLRKAEDPVYRELRYDNNRKEWLVRGERIESINTDEFGHVCFHTRLHYDTDPSFLNSGRPVQRALIVLTVYGKRVPTQTLVIPYYPLPASRLVSDSTKVGFESVLYEAKTEQNQTNYDFVLCRKPT
jgi:SAM-dependent methyltransferase